MTVAGNARYSRANRPSVGIFPHLNPDPSGCRNASAPATIDDG